MLNLHQWGDFRNSVWFKLLYNRGSGFFGCIGGRKSKIKRRLQKCSRRKAGLEKPGTAGDLPNLGRQNGEGTLLSVSRSPPRRPWVVFIGGYPSKQILNAPFRRPLPPSHPTHHNLVPWDGVTFETVSFGSTKVFHFHFVVKRFSPHRAPLPLQTAD